MKKDKYLKDLFELLAIPTISAQAEHNEDIKKGCEWLKDKLEKLGFTTNIFPTKGHPIVYAEDLTAGDNKPTIIIYGHYDVQSPDPLDNWNSDPFKPEVRSGNIYARGAADDKGQLYTWIAAVEQIITDNKKLPINIKFLLEGEEEVGSHNINEFVEKNSSILKADVCVISDSHSMSETQPMITYGLKGIIYTQIKVQTLTRDVHSGMYGGNVLNPANVLAQIISQLKDKNHKILIPGFYDEVRELDKKEVEDLAKFPFTVKEVMEETGAKTVAGEQGFSVAARAGARPTLDVNGMWSGYIMEGQKTIIPSHASAKISMRLVPYQNPQDIFKKFESYVNSITPDGVEMEIQLMSTGDPIIMDKDSKYFKAAEKAFEKVFGNKPIYELTGGSIPITAMFKNTLGMDSILMGYGLPDDNLHSPNEKLSVDMFYKGIETNINFINSLK